MATLDGWTALVTGATSGIGRAIALQLGGLGADVIVHGRDSDRGADTVREIEDDGGRGRFVAADLHDVDDIRRLASDVGAVDILVNNAGTWRFGATAETSDADFEDQVNVNMRAPYILVQSLAPAMAARGRGVVINLSTMAASIPGRGAGTYGATKAALELYTRVWADEFGRSGVRVNAVAAGPTYTPGTDVTPGLTDTLGSLMALGRAASAEEIAAVATFLATPASSYVNGAIVPAYGGQLAVAPF